MFYFLFVHIIEFRPWEWLKYCLNQRSIIMIFCSLVYVYICLFNISRTKTGAPLHVFLRSLFSTFILVYFWCLAPSLCFQTPLFSHKNESSSLCTRIHTITQCGYMWRKHQIGSVTIWQSSRHKAISCIQHFVYSTLFFDWKKINGNFEKKNI